MAGTGTEADLSWKEKYDKSEKSLTNLKSLAHKAVADYEDLLRKYDQNQKQYEELKQRLVATEKQLSDLQNVLEPVYDEYNELDLRYKIEKGCRNQAEHYATKVVQENKKLKRQSQLLVQSMNSVDLSMLAAIEKEADTATENGTANTEDQTEHFNTMIEELQGQVVQLQHKLTKAETERDACQVALRNIQTQYEAEKQVAARLQTALEHHDAQLHQFKRVSLTAYNEYGELMDRFSNERKLKNEAEKFASQMLSQRDAMARESSVLIGSAMSDERLKGALLQIEDLNKELELERTEHRQKEAALDEQLKAATEVHDIEEKLHTAVDQIELLQTQLTEAQSWWTKLEKRNSELENRLDVTSQKLDIAEQKLKPPPPPPPPPLPTGGLFRPLKNLIRPKKQPASNANKDNRDPKFEDAMKEMMERIKGGATLRPVGNRRKNRLPDEFTRSPSLPDMEPEEGKAMQDLQQMLATMKMRSLSTSVMTESSGQAGEVSELHATFMRIRCNPKSTNPPDQTWQTGDSPNRNLSLIEEVEEKDSLRRRSRKSGGYRYLVRSATAPETYGRHDDDVFD